ncbi:hypothetical protein QE152_g40182 [Popillia japonica]|uniref:Transposase Helix-turn-helix domain-containing protein n=1 Tax=Popillia japonica TaxID=7064 RepID=A0AAW1HS09_POPJA
MNKVVKEYIVDDLYGDDEFYELLESSSSSSCSSLESLSNRKSATHIMDYLNVIKEYSNKEFIKHFRLNRITADYLIACIEAAHITSEERTGREKLTPEEAIYITLWYLSNTETFRQLADRFNKSESTVL